MPWQWQPPLCFIASSKGVDVPLPRPCLVPGRTCSRPLLCQLPRGLHGQGRRAGAFTEKARPVDSQHSLQDASVVRTSRARSYPHAGTHSKSSKGASVTLESLRSQAG